MKKLQRGVSYVFCGMRVLIDVTLIVFAILIFSTFITKADSTSMFLLYLGAFLVSVAIVGIDLYYVVRDIKHIKNTNPDNKQDDSEKNKIEF